MRMMNCLTKNIKQNNKNRIGYGNSITGTLLLRIVARTCLVCRPPISDKAKIRFMYVGAALSLMAVPMMSHYIAGLNNIVDELRYQAVLVFIVVVCCYCFVMANMVKYNVMKKKVAVLEDTVEKLEQERAAPDFITFLRHHIAQIENQ